jgi:hypothetical protein
MGCVANWVDFVGDRERRSSHGTEFSPRDTAEVPKTRGCKATAALKQAVRPQFGDLDRLLHETLAQPGL